MEFQLGGKKISIWPILSEPLQTISFTSSLVRQRLSVYELLIFSWQVIFLLYFLIIHVMRRRLSA